MTVTATGARARRAHSAHSAHVADNSKKRVGAQDRGTFSTLQCGKCSTVTAEPDPTRDNSKKRSSARDRPRLKARV
jgi:hypothetical protein